MKNYAIVNVASGAVVNTIQYETAPTKPPPGFDSGYIAVQSDVADIHWYWDGKSLAPPPTVAVADDFRVLAQSALDASDITALRCFKAGAPFPKEWQTYTTTLRSIIRTGTGPLPARPAYPAGT